MVQGPSYSQSLPSVHKLSDQRPIDPFLMPAAPRLISTLIALVFMTRNGDGKARCELLSSQHATFYIPDDDVLEDMSPPQFSR